MPLVEEMSGMETDHYGRPVMRQPRAATLPYGDYGDERENRGRSRARPNYFRPSSDPEDAFRNYVRRHASDKRSGPMSSPPVMVQPMSYPGTMVMPPYHGPPTYPSASMRPPPPRRPLPREDDDDDEPSRDWSSGIFDCTMDTDICLCVMLNPFYQCLAMDEFDESFLLPFLPGMWGPGALIALRARERDRLNIEGSLLEDWGSSVCCFPCTFCQLMREKRFVEAEENGEVYPAEKRQEYGHRRRSHRRDRYGDRRRRDDDYEEDPYGRY